MSEPPLVSVIMPFLDAGPYLAEAIDSVIGQTFRRWELLLVDDGSSDSSPRIAADYAEREPSRIQVLQHAGRVNRGIAASRNLGMRAARGRYLAFLDADDVYVPHRLERHLQFLEADPGLGIVLSTEVYWHSWQPASAQSAFAWDLVNGPSAEPRRRIEPPAFIASTLVTPGAAMPSPCSITFRKAAFDEIGGIPESFRGHYDDQVLFCKLLLEYPVLVLDEPLARYRQHAGSITQANAPLDRVPGSAAHAARLRFLTWLQAHLAERSIDLPDVQSWLNAEIEALTAGPAPEQAGGKRWLRTGARRAALALLPRPCLGQLARAARSADARRLRRRVMQRVAEYEASPAGRDRAIRAYWDRRVDDTKLSDDAPGTAGFYAALDSYRLRKNDYLPRVVDFGAWAGRDLLEIGCGAGLDLVRFARRGARVTGVDLAPVAIELARNGCRVAGVQAALLLADGARLPFADASFDLVYCHGVLSFARDPARVVAEASRVLRPGGQAILMVYNRRSWMSLLLNMPGFVVDKGHADAPGFRTYSKKEFGRLLEPFPDRRFVFARRGWHLLGFCRKDGG